MATPITGNPPKVKLELVGLDSNIFSLLGAFNRAARRQGWNSQQLAEVSAQVTGSGSFDQALNVLVENTTSPEDEEE